jgi:hypothetical protein
LAKYDPLGDHLSRTVGPVEMSFEEVARLVGGLPPSAYRWRAWWANDPHHVEAAAWLAHRRRVETVDLVARRVRFS